LSLLSYGVLEIEIRQGPFDLRFADEAYEIRATVNGEELRSLLTEVEAGHLRGTLSMPNTRARFTDFELARTRSPDPRDCCGLVDTWRLFKGRLRAAASQATELLEATVVGTAVGAEYPRLLRSGYTVVISGVPNVGGAVLTFDIFALRGDAGAAQEYPPRGGPRGTVAAPPRDEIIGDDGLAGCLPFGTCAGNSDVTR
jgi:hypothetical protein